MNVTEAPARLGLCESLEEYATRIGESPSAARHAWRVEGLRLLGLYWRVNAMRIYFDGLCVIGGPVPVGPEPAEVLAEDDDDGHNPRY